MRLTRAILLCDVVTEDRLSHLGANIETDTHIFFHLVFLISLEWIEWIEGRRRRRRSDGGQRKKNNNNNTHGSNAIVVVNRHHQHPIHHNEFVPETVYFHIRPIMLICIGGVCVPYTAVVPLVVLALKWVVVRLAQMGLFPKAVADALHVSIAEEKGSELINAVGPSAVKTLTSEEEFQKLLDDPTQRVVCKFTARWALSRYRHAWHVYSSNLQLLIFSIAGVNPVIRSSHFMKNSHRTMPSRPSFLLWMWMTTTKLLANTTLPWCRLFWWSKGTRY